MEIFFYVIFTLLGLVIASFLNVCIDRLPAGGSIVNPPSHCDACGKHVAYKDLIPIYSYLRLYGKCRYCHAHISVRVLWVEIGTGVLFAFLFWRFGLSVQFGITAFYSCIFIVLLVIDLEHSLLLNKIVYPSMIATLLINLAISVTRPEWRLLLNSVIAGAIGFGIFFLIVIISRGGMGWGDVKMAGLIGLVTGLPQVFVAILIGIFLGGITAIVLLVFKIRKRKQAIPFGPFLAIGAMVSLAYGQVILDWYLNGLFKIG
jgi:leader peptidase (prepilin peptidase) / N-methyltransferase